MTNFTEPTNVDDLIGLWDFLSGNETADTGLDDGLAQNGNAVDGNGVAPAFSNGQLLVGGGSNSDPTVFDVNANANSSSDDSQFNLDRGTIEVQFTQSSQSGSSDDVILSRGEKKIDEDDEGFFEIRVTSDGRVQSYHNTDDGDSTATLSTSEWFFSPGDLVNVKYSFDEDTGARLTVENLTTGEIKSLTTSETGLTFDLTDNDDEEFTFGAREKDDGAYDKEFQGAIDYVALYTTTNDPISNPDPVGPNYIVEGTSAGELIDAGYSGDPEGDMIDAFDNDLTPPNNDDVVEAGAGDDTVLAGDGDDTVHAGSGDDFVLGDDDNSQDGDDLLLGEGGDDTLRGLDGEDTLDGGAGNDLLDGMEGDDLLLGGSGDDRAYGGGGNDTIFGDEGGQDRGEFVRESFEWNLSPSAKGDDFSQDTGNVTVDFRTISADSGVKEEIADNAQNVSEIDSGSEEVDNTSSFSSTTNGRGNEAAYEVGFSDPVENVSFRVNDIDGDGIVKVQAFAANGDPIEVVLSAGSNLTLFDTDGVAGNDTADSNGGYLEDTSSEYSILVTIPGPVSEIKIIHSQDGGNNSGINVTDVFFDVPNFGTPEGSGDDTLIGGAGDDLIYGNEGDDSIQGNAGDDTLFGDDPAEGTPVSGNLIFNGSFEITSGMATTGYGFVGDGTAPGWTDANGNEIDFHNDGRGGVNPTEGDNWLDLEASPGNNRVGQIVDGVQDGETYKLTFDAGDKRDEPQSGTGENLIQVYWGGQLIATVDPEGGQMNEYTFNVTGGSGDGSNKLEFVGLGAEDNFGASIDSVSLVQLAGTPGEGGNDTIEGGTGTDEIVRPGR